MVGMASLQFIIDLFIRERTWSDNGRSKEDHNTGGNEHAKRPWSPSKKPKEGKKRGNKNVFWVCKTIINICEFKNQKQNWHATLER